MKRQRMMVDLSEVYQMALRLRALKEGISIAEALQNAVGFIYPQEVKEAAKYISQRKQTKETT